MGTEIPGGWPTTQLELAQAVARTEQKVDSLVHALLGNGNPGSIRLHEDRLRELEESKAQQAGVIRFLAWLGSITGMAEILHWLIGRHQ